MVQKWRAGAGSVRLLLLLSIIGTACAAPLAPTPTPIRPISATATARAAAATAEVAATAEAVARASARGTAISATQTASLGLGVGALNVGPPTATRTTTMPANSPVNFIWELWGDTGRMERVTRVAVGGQGVLYLLDVMTHQIYTVDHDGQIKAAWGSQGTSPGQLSFMITGGTTTNPFAGALAADHLGHVYVADLSNRIQKFDQSGTLVLAWGREGSRDGEFSRPVGLAVDRLGNVYVADGDNGRIQKFDSTGKFLTKWGSEGMGDGEFFFRFPPATSTSPPQVAGAVAVDGLGNVYVADRLARIQKFDSDGRYLMQYGVRGTGVAEFGTRGVVQIAADPRGYVYVADSGNSRIQVFNHEGNYLAQWGVSGNGVGQFNFMAGIAVDAQGGIYVVESFTNRRVQKFTPRTPWPTGSQGTPTPRPPTPTVTPTNTPGPTSTPQPSRFPSQTPTDR